MKSLKESLFDKDLVSKEIGWCLGEKFTLQYWNVAKGRCVIAANPDYINKQNWLSCINWRTLKKELSKLKSRNYTIDKQWYTGGDTGPQYDNTKATEQKMLEVADFILNMRLIEEYVKGGYNSRLRDEIESYLNKILLDPEHFKFEFSTHKGMYININLETISVNPTPYSCWTHVAGWYFISRPVTEGLFDDDLATKPILNWDWFKMPRNQRSMLFYEIFNIMFSPDDYIPRWVLKHYELHKLEFDYIIQCLRSAFKKQSYVSWFYIDSSDMEMIGDEMTEEQITKVNNEMRQYFSKGVYTTRGIFIMGDEKMPACIKDLIKKTDHWNHMLSTTKEWAIEYYEDDGTMMIFVCPKGLNPDIEKLLYN